MIINPWVFYDSDDIPDLNPHSDKEITMIKEAYVSFEVAKLLKEKGFDWSCGDSYVVTDKIICQKPTHQMAMTWLRQTYKINIVIMPVVTDDDGDGGCLYEYIIFKRTKVIYKSECLYEKYGVACDDALKYVLENLI